MAKQTKPEVIYDRVEFIGATKGRRSAYPGQKFRHDFKPGAKDIALPDRTLVVTPGGTFRPADGSALLTSRLRRVKNPPRLHTRIGRDHWHVNPPKKRKRNPLLTVIGANPPRRSSMLGLGLFNAENLKKVGAAGVGAVASASLPAMVLGAGVSTTQAYLAQAVIGVGGAWAVGRFVGKAYALPWFLGAGVGAVQDPIRRAVARAYGAVAGALSPAAAPAMGAYYEDSPRYLSHYSGRLGPLPALSRYSPVTSGI